MTITRKWKIMRVIELAIAIFMIIISVVLFAYGMYIL